MTLRYYLRSYIKKTGCSLFFYDIFKKGAPYAAFQRPKPSADMR